MKVDVVVIGASPASLAMSSRHARKGFNVIVAALPGNPESYQRRLLEAISTDPDRHQPHPPPDLSLLPEVKVISGPCWFDKQDTVFINREKVTAARFVIASGVRPLRPPIQGLDHVSSQDPIEVVSSPTVPSAVLVVGTGPVGVATALKLTKKGCQVTLVGRRERILFHEDDEIAAKWSDLLTEQGVVLRLNSQIIQLRSPSPGLITAVMDTPKGPCEHSADRLVLAAGLAPNSKTINLRAANVYTDETGWIVVNEEMKTSSSKAWAMGPVTGPESSFGMETVQADLISRNMISPFFSRRKLEPDNVYLFTMPTDPSFARVGLTETQARGRFRDVVVSITEDVEKKGLIKLAARKNGELIGAHVISKQAPTTGFFFQLAMRMGVTLFELEENLNAPSYTEPDFIHQAIQDWLKTSA